MHASFFPMKQGLGNPMQRLCRISAEEVAGIALRAEGTAFASW